MKIKTALKVIGIVTLIVITIFLLIKVSTFEEKPTVDKIYIKENPEFAYLIEDLKFKIIHLEILLNKLNRTLTNHTNPPKEVSNKYIPNTTYNSGGEGNPLTILEEENQTGVLKDISTLQSN